MPGTEGSTRARRIPRTCGRRSHPSKPKAGLLGTPLRYTERNPVRAGLVEAAENWRWSSAAVHCCMTLNDGLLELAPWQERWDSESWLRYLREKDAEEEVAALRECTHTGRPFGAPEFVKAMEAATQRCLTLQRRGRRKKKTEATDGEQSTLAFDESLGDGDTRFPRFHKKGSPVSSGRARIGLSSS